MKTEHMIVKTGEFYLHLKHQQDFIILTFIIWTKSVTIKLMTS